jgi:hypothetical protein
MRTTGWSSKQKFKIRQHNRIDNINLNLGSWGNLQHAHI